MTHKLIIAQNAFTVSIDENIPAWRELNSHFAPFEVASIEKPLIEIDIKVDSLPICNGEKIYEPEHEGLGIVSASVSRLPDNSIILKFCCYPESKERLWMKLPPQFNSAEIRISPDCDDCSSPLLSHAIMLAYMLAAGSNGTVMFHSSSVISDGKAYLFQGRSGTGKSTHARLWTQNIPATELLNDDNPIVRIDANGTPIAYGSPWSGKTHCYRNESAPIGACIRIIRAENNKLYHLPPLQAFASLTPSVFFLPFMPEQIRQARHRTIEHLVQAVPCYEMYCRPDADAARTCRQQLYEHA